MSVNLLNLKDMDVVRVETTEDAYRIHARSAVPPVYCPSCGVAEPKARRFGKRVNRFADLPTHGRRTEIVVDRQRYQCMECGGAFLEPLPAMDPAHDATKRMVHWVEQQALRRPFAHVAKELEISEPTVRRIFAAFMERLEAGYAPGAPPILGIDEVHLLGRPRAVFTNISRRCLLGMLPGHGREAVTRFLLDLKSRERTEAVAIDMHRPYKAAVEAAMPGAVVVIDRFHVARIATSAVEGVRKAVRKGLNSRQRVQLKNDRFLLLRRASELKPHQRLIVEAWGGAYPDLVAAWQLKEAFLAIYDADTKDEARERMHAWVASVPTRFRVKAFFGPGVSALTNWEPEILAYWDHRITNAFTESFNNQIRTIERSGRGYSFEVLRAKALHTPPAWVEKERKAKGKAKEAPEHLRHLPTGWRLVRSPTGLWVLTTGTDDAANNRFALYA